jgi:VanZ family protein
VISLWLPVAAYMAAIYFGAAMPQMPGPPAQLSDTLLHAGCYAGLALLTLRATAGGRWRGVTPHAIAIAFVIATVHGITVEVEQMFIPSRMAEWRDIGNDTIGVLAALGAAWAWSKLFKE